MKAVHDKVAEIAKKIKQEYPIYLQSQYDM